MLDLFLFILILILFEEKQIWRAALPLLLDLLDLLDLLARIHIMFNTQPQTLGSSRR